MNAISWRRCNHRRGFWTYTLPWDSHKHAGDFFTWFSYFFRVFFFIFWRCTKFAKCAKNQNRKKNDRTLCYSKFLIIAATTAVCGPREHIFYTDYEYVVCKQSSGIHNVMNNFLVRPPLLPSSRSPIPLHLISLHPTPFHPTPCHFFDHSKKKVTTTTRAFLCLKKQITNKPAVAKKYVEVLMIARYTIAKSE